MNNMPQETESSQHPHAPYVIGVCAVVAVAVLAIVAWMYTTSSGPSEADIENARKNAVLRELSATRNTQITPEEKDAVLTQLQTSGNTMNDTQRNAVLRALQNN